MEKRKIASKSMKMLLLCCALYLSTSRYPSNLPYFLRFSSFLAHLAQSS